MKHFLLLSAAALLTLSANAQTLSVTVMGNQIENGATANAYCLEKEEGEDQFGPYYMARLNPEVKASSSTGGSFNITVTNTTSGTTPIASEILYCWPFECKSIGQGQSATQQGSLTPQFSDLAIDTAYWDEPVDGVFTISCKVEIVEVGNTSNKFTFDLNMIHDASHNTSVHGIADSYEGPVEYFDLTGRKITNPGKGKIVIEKRGSKAKKVLIK